MLVKFRLNALTAAEVQEAAQELYQEEEAKLQRDLRHLATWAQQSPHLASIRRDEVSTSTGNNIAIHDDSGQHEVLPAGLRPQPRADQGEAGALLQREDQPARLVRWLGH